MTEFIIPKRMTVFAFAAMAFLIIAAAVCFLFFDQQVTHYLYKHDQHWDNGWAVKTFQYLGKAWLLVWLILFWVILTRQNRVIIYAILTFLAVGVIVLPLKLLVQRERPSDFIDRVYEQKNEDHPPALLRSWSFPSGDTANVFAVATMLLPFVRRRLIIFFFVASCFVGLLRILVFAHYPSDTFAGAAAGIFAGFTVLKMFHRRPLPPQLDSKRFLIAQILAFISIPCFFAVLKFKTFVDIICTYGVLLALILFIHLLQRKYSISKDEQR
jgi:membrane-associated phospholipid phosphatase